MGPIVLTLMLAIPLCKGLGPTLGSDSEIQDLTDPGFHFHNPQLFTGGMVGAARPEKRPHLTPPLSEQLDLAAEKCLKKVYPDQPLLS
jgi:hypothetical protein